MYTGRDMSIVINDRNFKDSLFSKERYPVFAGQDGLIHHGNHVVLKAKDSVVHIWSGGSGGRERGGGGQ